MEDRLRLLLEETSVDFASWTSFLDHVEEASPDDFAKVSSIYEPFLSKFPLCYGYWRKYASHACRLCGADKAVEVFEQAVRVATYSVDLWANYCSFAVQFYEDPEDVRQLFERGLSYVGKDYLCYILWDKYIEFEYSLMNWTNLAHIYIKILAFPSKKLHCYQKSFKKLVVIWKEEMQWKSNDLVPPEVSPKACNHSEILEVINSLINEPKGRLQPIMLKKYISTGDGLYDKSSQLDKKIIYFEDTIHRSYFHPKPLEDHQLENWHGYLDFVESQGDFDWTVKLYERCLIPCANYQEFWIRYAEHMEAKGGREIACFALERASNSFLKEDATFHLYCARFKERVGDNFGARASFLLCKSDTSSNYVENVDREANMEKRLGNIDAALVVYEKAILLAEEKKNFQILPVLYIHFARFKFIVTESLDAARMVFLKAIRKVSQSKTLLEGLMQFMIVHGSTSQINFVDSVVADALNPQAEIHQGLSLADQESISLLFIEFVDLYGTIHEIEKAWDRHRKLFPHQLRPDCSPGLVLKNATLENCPSKGSNGSGYKHLSPEKNISTISNGAETSKFESQKGNAIHLNFEKLIFTEDAEMKCGKESAKLPSQSATKGHVVQVLNNSNMDAKIPDQIQGRAGFSSPDLITLSAIESQSSGDGTNKSPSSFEKGIASQSATLRLKKSENWDSSDCRTLDFPESTEAQKQSGVSTCAHEQSDAGHVTNLGTPLAQNNTMPPKIQEDKHLEKAASLNGAHPNNLTQGASSSQMHAVGLMANPGISAHDPRYERQPNSFHSSSGAGGNQRMLSSQGLQFQKLDWQQEINHWQDQSQIANAQVYQSGSFPCLWSNLQQQGLSPACQPQIAMQLVPHSQDQLYQNSIQSNGQYGYFENGQGCLPQAWYYYYQQQQQLYNLHLMQQNLQWQQQQQQIDNGQSQHLQQMSINSQQPDDQEQIKASQKQSPHQSKEPQNLPKHWQQQIQQSHRPHLQENCQLQNHEQTLYMQKQQQTNNQLQQLQQKQQQQLLLQQQHYQVQHNSEAQQQHYQVQHNSEAQQQQYQQLQITPLEIQALSDKYLQVQGQHPASENVEAEKPASTCPSQQLASSEK